MLRFVIIAIFATLFFLCVATWLPNISLLRALIIEAPRPSAALFSLATQSFAILQANTSFFVLWLLVLNAILFGVTSSLLVAVFIRQRAMLSRASGVTLGAFFLSLLGLGCASCGSLLLSLVGALGAVAFLPFGGIEFHIASTILLLFSLYSVVGRFMRSSRCAVSAIK